MLRWLRTTAGVVQGLWGARAALAKGRSRYEGRVVKARVGSKAGVLPILVRRGAGLGFEGATCSSSKGRRSRFEGQKLL